MNRTSADLNMLLDSGIIQVTLFLITDFYLQDPEKFHNLDFSMPFLSCSSSCINDLIVCKSMHDGVNLFLTPQEFIGLSHSNLTFVVIPTFGI